MNNVTKFIVVIAVIGAGVCAALPFRRMPPPSESTLAQDDTPDKDPEALGTSGAKQPERPPTDRVELNMTGTPDQPDEFGIADFEQHDASRNENPWTTHAPQIRAPRKQKSEFADFAEQCLEMGYRAFKIHPWVEAPITITCGDAWETTSATTLV